MKSNDIKLEQTFASLLCNWYDKNARDLPWRKDRDPYHVWLSEIMLQQTRVEAVVGYYTRFLEQLPTVSALSNAKEQQLLKLWEGLGYYNRARNLHKTANIIAHQYAGVFPADYGSLLALPGVGPYTAGAIASICFGQRIPAVDGNVVRVLARLLELDEPFDSPSLKKDMAQALCEIYPAGKTGAFTQALMELGATVCIPNGTPKCALCPVCALCGAHKNGTTDTYPIRAKKAARRKEKRTVFVLTCDGSYAICRRGKTGLLAGMWELPNLSGHLDAQQAADTAAGWNAQPYDIQKTINRTHIFTHIEWHMVCHYILCAHKTERFTWATPDALRSRYALPTAFRIFLEP